uniref:non-specific serine/threonine protein kinase n=1 Tax=Oryzias latipes TaxID=8090 RepID=A0A3B3HCH7_ORYLA
RSVLCEQTWQHLCSPSSTLWVGRVRPMFAAKKKNRSFCHGRHPGKVLDVQPLPGRCDGISVALKFVPLLRTRCCEVDGTSKPLEAVALEMVSKDPPFPGIIRMLDFYKTRGAWVIITEKPENTQDLFDYITTCKLLREDTAREFLGQVIQALLHCHSRGVVHMDVKDENLLLDLSTRKLLLIDFGSAVFLKPDKEYDTFDGTATYAPPERLTRGCYKALPSEVWSLRILLYDMVSTPEERPTLKDILAHTWMLKRADGNGSQSVPLQGYFNDPVLPLTAAPAEWGEKRNGPKNPHASLLENEKKKKKKQCVGKVSRSQ